MDVFFDSKYLVFPASHYAKQKRISFRIEGKVIYDFVMPLDYRNPDYEFYLNVERFRGQTIDITCDADVDLEIRKSNEGLPVQQAYVGKYRPLAHFTAKRGWINDPNGLVYYRGKYLMFYQHNPVGCDWENMHWGWAVSDDFVHWQEKEIAFYPDENGTVFSGSAIVDHRNVAGLKQNDHDAILIFYTAAGSTSEASKNRPFTQCLAYSLDGGESFIKYPKNPLINQIVGGNRDPKVIYYAPMDRYIMSFYLDNHEYVLYASQNLLEWEPLQKLTIPNEIECPDLYPLAVDGNRDHEKWVFIGASDRYLLGSFDGMRFCPEGEPRQLNFGNNSYAAQTWSNVPGDRRIRTAFATVVIPGMPFGSCMNIPQEMSLKTINGEICLCAQPVEEIRKLYCESRGFSSIEVTEGHPFIFKTDGRCLDISLTIKLEGNIKLSLFGLTLEYRTDSSELVCQDKTAPVKLMDGSLDIRMIVDTVYAEIFVNQGSTFLGMTYIQDCNLNRLKIESDRAWLEQLTVSQLGTFYSQEDGPSSAERE